VSRIMRKRLCILTLLFALLLLVWVVPASAEEVVIETTEIVYTEELQPVIFSGNSGLSLLSEDPETWNQDWKEYEDQLDGYAEMIYDALEENFNGGKLPDKTSISTQDGDIACWNMNAIRIESKSFAAATLDEAKTLCRAWNSANLSPAAEKAAVAFTYDHPEYFWLRTGFFVLTGSSISTAYDENGVPVKSTAIPSVSVVFIVQPIADNDTPDEISNLQEQLDGKVDEILNAANGMNSREKVEYFDQWLAANVHYDCAALEAGEGLEKDETPWSVVGALLNGQAVCEGYAKALQLLCHESGIPCITISGKAWNTLPATGDGEDHMWTAVQLDGTWHFCDPTWNDPVISSTVEESTGDYSTKEYLLVAQPESHKAVEPFILPDLSGMPVEISVNLETGKLEGRETSTTQVKMFIALFDEHRRMIACGVCEEKTVTTGDSQTVYTYYPPEFDAEDVQSADSIVRFVLTPDHVPDGETKDLLN